MIKISPGGKNIFFCFLHLNKIPMSQIVCFMKFSPAQTALISHLICSVNEMGKSCSFCGGGGGAGGGSLFVCFVLLFSGTA